MDAKSYRKICQTLAEARYALEYQARFAAYLASKPGAAKESVHVR